MLQFNYGTKMGAKFKLTNVDSQGNVTRSSEWFSNMILNNAVNTMPTGFTELPIPVLGSAITQEAGTQTGVLTPLTDMVCYANKELWGAKYTKESDNVASVSWGHRYSYKNESTKLLDVGEIGIANFNRAVFRDDSNNAFTWSVSVEETLIVEMEFIIKITGPVQPVSINIVDQDNVIVKSMQVKLCVCDQLEEGTPIWWKLLSEPKTNVYYTTDTNFNGTIKPLASTMKPVAVSSEYDYTNRVISMTSKHRGVTGGENLTGLLFHFGCLSPVLTAVFVEPIYVGGGYTFEATATLTW